MSKKELKNRKKVGLALSGGGWRGIAHIGVLKALEENNIPIDFIAGTSAGALFGGLYSYFGNYKELENFVTKFGYRDLFKAVVDPRIRGGFLKGQKMVKYLNDLTNHAKIEDLKIPFSAVTTDLITSNTHYIRDGKLSEAIRASVSIPLVFRPVNKDGMKLVDGGVTENIPIKCVKDMGADIVIATNVNTTVFPVTEKDLNSTRKIAAISARAVLNTLSDVLSLEADVLIEPKIKSKNKTSFGVSYFLEFVKEKDIIKTGEEATKESMKDIKKFLRM
jgi:NTE family protein